jgi:superfamily II DNA/RNA helicase
MAEELQKYLDKLGILCRYIHSEIDTIERVEILRQLRLGVFDVLIGVNLLREGLDLPEVSLVAILDADKEGFLRNERSLVQTVGRAARNLNGMVIMYADKMTNSMQKTIDETLRRRELQDAYNKENGLVPTALNKSKEKIIDSTQVADGDQAMRQLRYEQSETVPLAAEEAPQYSDSEELRKQIKVTKKAMESAAKELDFIDAARLRDRLFGLEKQVKKCIKPQFTDYIEAHIYLIGENTDVNLINGDNSNTELLEALSINHFRKLFCYWIEKNELTWNFKDKDDFKLDKAIKNEIEKIADEYIDHCKNAGESIKRYKLRDFKNKVLDKINDNIGNTLSYKTYWNSYIDTQVEIHNTTIDTNNLINENIKLTVSGVYGNCNCGKFINKFDQCVRCGANKERFLEAIKALITEDKNNDDDDGFGICSNYPGVSLV